MDDFEYFYQESLNGGRNNRLSGLKDHAGASMYDGADIDNAITSTNYKYDLIGQLLRDEADGIEHIDWYVGSKKIKRIKRSDNNSPELEFKYNPLGQRVLKITKPRVNGVIVTQNQWIYTYYSYEAGGNVSAVYKVSLGGQTAKATLTEQHIYGAGRLGMIQQDRSLYANGTLQPLDDTLYVKHIEGRTYYELSNYLGNVEAVVNDRKMWSGSDYEAVVINYADYYPFGMLMPKRHHSETSYRYAYNGMEADNEVKGNGNSYTTEFRQYDPRLGRWLSLDPLMDKYPDMSPYCAFNNNPIYYIDPYGLEGGPAKELFKLPEVDETEKTNQNSTSLSSHQNNIPQNKNPFYLKINTLNSIGSINTSTFERYKDLTLASGYGKPLTKEVLLKHYKDNFCKTCTEGQLQNKTGHYFEQLFEDYLDREFSFAQRKLIIKNTMKVEGEVDGEIKHSVPDYIGLMVSSKKVFPDAVNISSLYELKATKNNIGVGSFEGQLKIQIKFAKKTKGKELIVITTSDITLSKNLRTYAINNGVTLTHYTANYTSYKHLMSISLKLKTY